MPLYNSIEEALDAAKEIANRQLKFKDDRIKILVEENTRLKAEHYKDEKIKELIEENARLDRENKLGFPITEEQWTQIMAWQQYHIKKKHGGRQLCGVSGGRFSYEFCPTAMGTFGTCKCMCGEYFHFQDE